MSVRGLANSSTKQYCISYHAKVQGREYVRSVTIRQKFPPTDYHAFTVARADFQQFARNQGSIVFVNVTGVSFGPCGGSSGGGGGGGGGCTAPSAPVITAVADADSIFIDWAAASGATAYEVKRSTTPGGPYSTIAFNVVVTQYDDTTAVAGTTYYYVVISTNSCGASGNSNEASDMIPVPVCPGVDLELGLISYWKMDEVSGSRNDNIGSNNLPEVSGGISFDAGKILNAGLFSGAGFLSLTTNSSLEINDETFMFSAWVNLSDTTTETVVNKAISGSGSEYLLWVNNGFFEFVVWDNGAAATTLISAIPISTSTWYHVVAWYNKSNTTLNMVINNGSTESTAFVGTVLPFDSNFDMGGITSVGQVLNGLIDEVGFWKGIVPTSNFITCLYNSGNGRTIPIV